jgi:hypothetical protein
MKWARIVFGAAGLFGIAVLISLFRSPHAWGRRSAGPYYFGFATLALVGQIAFLVIAVDPCRFRPLMLVGVAKMWGFTLVAWVLHTQGRLVPEALAEGAVVDAVLGVAFVSAFITSRGSARARADRRT